MGLNKPHLKQVQLQFSRGLLHFRLGVCVPSPEAENQESFWLFGLAIFWRNQKRYQ
jgi:hypothetical protein